MAERHTILQAVLLVSLLMTGNFQCIHQSCPTRSLQLMEDGPSVMLPCDSNTSINSSSTTAGNYTYCHDATILVTHSTSYYTLGSINYALDNSQICCFDNQVQSCAVCYNLGVYFKPRSQDLRFIMRTIPVFGNQFSFDCKIIANPLPICEWRRQRISDLAPLTITSDAIFTNNNCTITFTTLSPAHMGQYNCIATNMLGVTESLYPFRIALNPCSLSNRPTKVDYTGPKIVRASFGDPVTFTCSVGSAAQFLTTIRFCFNNSCYLDPYYNGTIYSDVGIVVNATFNMSDCSVESTFLIKQFSKQFVGQYSCSVRLYIPLEDGDNVTFSLAVKTGEKEISKSDTTKILLIATPLGGLLLLLSLLMISFVLLIMRRRLISTSILKLPLPSYLPELYQYDVLISHAQDTEDYVNAVLKRGLMEKGYLVQTPADYVVGCTSDNIIAAFNTSRYVMILFSAAYDHHCSELQYAYNKVNEIHCNCLIPVKCGGKIPRKLERITYANYETDDVISRVEQTIGKPLHAPTVE